MRGDARTMDDHGQGRDDADPREHLRRYHLQTLWIPALLLLLGASLVLSPATFSHAQEGVRAAEVAEARGLASAEVRGSWTAASDVASGVLLVIFAALSLRPGSVWPRWAAAAVGTWLVFAPVLLWAPSPTTYLNDTLVGALVLALTVLVPMMPGMMLVMQPGPETPEGWSYNPSSWLQRSIVIALSWIGFFAARYLTAYQLGYVDSIWDPFFGGGTERVLESDVSRAFPVSDAGLGSSAILIEALMGYMGSPSRWRTMPWMVAFFGILVVPLGIVHVALVVSQPVLVGAWCTFCLVAAAAMLVMIPFAVDEVAAMLQFFVRRLRRGEPWWRVFFLGGTTDEAEPGGDERSPRYPATARELLAGTTWGVGLPWSIAASAALGLVAMALPGIVALPDGTTDGLHLLGALVLTVAVVATAEVVRAFRWLNVPAGFALAVLPWVTGAPVSWSIALTLLGLLIVATSIPRGAVHERYGGLERAIV